MRLTPHSKDKIRIIAMGLLVAVLVLTGIVAFRQGTARGRDTRSELTERSEGIAAALDEGLIAKLAGSSKDANSATYKQLKAQLAGVKKANPDARSIYLMGVHGQRLFFFVDSEQPSSNQYSPAGEWYDDGTVADHSVFTTGQAFVEGPAKDEYGTFISGIAPIFKPGTHTVVAVLGMDIDASTFYRDIAYDASVPIAVGLSVCIIIGFFEIIRGRNAALLAVRSELVSVASHELRNPITGIRWASDSLEKMITEPRAKKMAHAIYASAVRLQDSTDDILELSHAVNSRAFTIVPTDMTKLIHEIIDTQMLSAEQKNVMLVLDPSWPPELLMDCDAGQMKRALHNVVSNAIKYTREGSTVSVAYRDDGAMHQILIHDQGIGIPADEQVKVFRGFYRASNAVASKIDGTGLGLYLVKTVLERHNGSVRFTSEVNNGTTFVLSLPKHR